MAIVGSQILLLNRPQSLSCVSGIS